MCSIIGSFDKNKIIELNEINSIRGSFSYSIGYIDTSTNFFHITNQGFGEPPLEKSLKYSIFDNNYIVVHRQAPTSGLIEDPKRIHPAIEYDEKNNIYHCLYHNGIVKSQQLKKLEELYNQSFPWDTKAILIDIISKGLENSLSSLDASFACLYIVSSKEILLFRNNSSIIYYDKYLNISSQKFNNSIELPSNKIFSIDLKNRKLDEINSFTNIDDRYFVGE